MPNLYELSFKYHNYKYLDNKIQWSHPNHRKH